MRPRCSLTRLAAASALLATAVPARAQPKPTPPQVAPVAVKHYCVIDDDRIAFQISYVLQGIDRDGSAVQTRELVGIRCNQSRDWVTSIDSGGVSSKLDRWECKGAQMGMRDLDGNHAIGTFGGVAPMENVSTGFPAALHRQWSTLLFGIADQNSNAWDPRTRARALELLRGHQKRLTEFVGDKAPRPGSAVVTWGDSTYLIDAAKSRVQVLTASARVLATAEARCDAVATD